MEKTKLTAVPTEDPNTIDSMEKALKALSTDPHSREASAFVVKDVEESGRDSDYQILCESRITRTMIEMWLTFEEGNLDTSQKQAVLLIIASKLIKQLETSENSLLGEALCFCRDKLLELNYKNILFINAAIAHFSEEFRGKVKNAIDTSNRYNDPSHLLDSDVY